MTDHVLVTCIELSVFIHIIGTGVRLGHNISWTILHLYLLTPVHHITHYTVITVTLTLVGGLQDFYSGKQLLCELIKMLFIAHNVVS